MLKPGFTAPTALRYTRYRPPHRWACCAAPSRGGWDLAPAPRPRDRESHRSRYRDFRESRREREPPQRRPTSNPETRLIREVLDGGDELLYGVNPVLQALRSGRRPYFSGLFRQIREKSAPKGDNAAAVSEILRLASERGVRVHDVTKGGLNALVKERPHQGVVLGAGPLPVAVVTALEYAEEVWVALDQVSDPHNAGAILRSAAFLGARGVLLCRKNCCGVTPAVAKASAGASEVCDVRAVASMPRFLRGAKERGWRVVGLGVEGGVDLRQIDRRGGGVIVVVGSEGSGMRSVVRDACDQVVRIEGAPARGAAVDSLNVSVATGVALFQLLGAMKPPR